MKYEYVKEKYDRMTNFILTYNNIMKKYQTDK